MLLLSHKLGFEKKVKKSKKLNVTSESFGLDIQDKETIKALEPLVYYDYILYKEAKEKFEKEFTTFFPIKQDSNFYLDRIINFFKK